MLQAVRLTGDETVEGDNEDLGIFFAGTSHLVELFDGVGEEFLWAVTSKYHGRLVIKLDRVRQAQKRFWCAVVDILASHRIAPEGLVVDHTVIQ